MDFLHLIQKMGQSQPICPNDPFGRNHQWCNFEAVDQDSLIIEIIYLPFVLGIGVFAFINYRKIKKLRKQKQYESMFGNAYNWMHLIIIGWFICTILKLLLSIYTYYKFMYEDIGQGQIPDSPDPANNAEIVIWSQIYPILDFSSAFAVNLLLWLVSFQLQVPLLFSLKTVLVNVIMSQNVTFSTRKRFSYILVILKIVFVYCKYFRNIIIIFAILQPILFFTTDIHNKCSFAAYNYYLTTAESFLILICYILSFRVFRYILISDLIKITSRQLRIIIFQYGTLSLTLCMRVILNIITISRIGYLKYRPNGNCTDINTLNDSIQTIFLILHHFLMHMAPIILILIIYRPVIKTSTSLIDEDYLRNSQTLSDLRYDQVQKQFYQQSLIGPGDLDSVKTINEEINFT